MTKNLFFKPLKSELTCEQILNQIGVNPEGMDDEILLSYGLFPIEDLMDSRGILDNPHPTYIDKGTYFLKCPSPVDIDLGEGKFIAKSLLCKKANSDLEDLTKEFGFGAFLAPLLTSILDSETSPMVKNFRNRQSEIVVELDQNLRNVEEAKTVEDLRRILKL